MEGRREDQAKELAELLSSSEWYNDTPFLLRGSERDLETWKIKEPYDSRDPMTTAKKIQWFEELFREKFYPNYPSRNKSRFASVEEDIAGHYGDLFYVFPHETATLGSLPDDAYLSFLGPAEKDLASFYTDFESLLEIDNDVDEFKANVPNEVIDFCKLLMETKRRQDEEIVETIKKMLDNFQGDSVKSVAKEVEEAKFYVGRGEMSVADERSVKLINALRSLTDFLNHLSDYFSRMNVGSAEDFSKNLAIEVVMEGRLIQANKRFVDSYFEKTVSGFILNKSF